MKKKICIAILAVCMAMTAAGCGNDIIDTETSKKEAGKKTLSETRLVSVENLEDYITLGEYKGLELSNQVGLVTDDDVDAQIAENLAGAAKEVSDSIREGDIATINYVGTRNGETFDGGIANNYDLTVGEGHMIEGFENGLIGMKKGETKELNLTFPQDYGEADLAGQEVVFMVTVQKVRRGGELSDEWVKENTDCSSVDEYRESVKAQLEEEAQNNALELMKNDAWQMVSNSSEVLEYPETDLKNAVDEYKKQLERYAQQADMEFDEFLASQEISQKEFEEQCDTYAKLKLKQNMIIQAIMDAEGLSLEDEESLKIQEELIKSTGSGDLAGLIDKYGQGNVDETIGLLRVENFIVENATVNQLVSNGDTVGANADSGLSGNEDEESVTDEELEKELEGEIAEDTDTVDAGE